MMAARCMMTLLIAVTLAMSVVDAQKPLDLSVKALVSAASAYVADYETKFKFVVADEVYTQTTYDKKREQTATRRMTGELFLTFLRADLAWMSVHDFAEVDGKPVGDREDLRALLQKGETTSVARRIRSHNSQYNLGGVARNINEPTLALLILEPGRVKNFAFERTEVIRDGERTRVQLSFKERVRPTLIRNSNGSPMYAKGEITIDAATGRIERTVIELDDNGVIAKLTTTYAPEEKVGMWVPVSFDEHYEQTRAERELILCESFYTNFRKFDVTARIK